MTLRFSSMLKTLVGLCIISCMQPAQAITLSATFNDLNAQVFSPSVVTPGAGQTVSVDLALTNATGLTWTDFHFGTAGPLGGNVFFGDLLGTTTGYIGPGTASFGATRAELNVVGLNIPDGTIYYSSVQLVFGEAPVALIGGYPTVGPPVPAPEPGSLFLLSLGLAGLGLSRRRKTH